MKEMKINHSKRDLSSAQMRDELGSFHADLIRAVAGIENAFENTYVSSQKTIKPKSADKPVSSEKLIKGKQQTNQNSEVVRTKPREVKKTSQLKPKQGNISYKVKGKNGKLMNIADITKWVNSLYDEQSGLVKND